MKRVFLILSFFVGTILQLYPQAVTENAIKKYVAEYPNVVRKNFLYEGSSLSVSTNEEHLFVQLYVAHPELLMRMIMQGGTIYIDPTGKKKEKYAIILPSAKDIKDQMGDFMPTPPSTDKVNGEEMSTSERPNIQPVIFAMSMHGATFDIDGEERLLYDDSFSMLLDEENNAVIYNILLPRNDLDVRKPSKIWAFGLYLGMDEAPQQPMRPQPGVGASGGGMGGPGGGMGGPGGGMRGPGGLQMQGPSMRPQHRENYPVGDKRPQQKSGNDNHDSLQRIMSEEVEEWIFLSIDEISSVNSK